jgi:hypothetical protein
MLHDNCFDLVQLRGSAEEDLKVYHPDEFDFVLYNKIWKDKIIFNEKQSLRGFAYAIRKGTTCLDK